MSEPDMEIMTTNELKIFVSGKIDALESHLNRMESDLKIRLDKIDETLKGIDEDIRGNGGKVGINVRLDRLEKAKSVAFWVICLFASALLAGGIAHYFSLIEKLIGK